MPSIRPTSVLALALTLALAGCGNDQAGLPAPAATPAADQPAPAPSQPTAVAPAAAASLVASDPVQTQGAASLNSDCNVEGVDGVLFEGQALPLAKGEHHVTGWIVDSRTKTVPAELRLAVTGVGDTKGTWLANTPKRIARQGVVETRGYDAAVLENGFDFTIDSSQLPAGTYHVFVVTQSGGLAVCDPGRQVVIGG